jgi:hypothetical protein
MSEPTWRFSDLRIPVFVERFFQTDEWRQHRPLGDDDANAFLDLVYDLKESAWLESVTHAVWWHDQAAFDCAKAAFRYAAIKQYSGMPSIEKIAKLSSYIRADLFKNISEPYSSFSIEKQDEILLSALLKGIPLCALLDSLYTAIADQRIETLNDKDKLRDIIISKMWLDGEKFATHILSITNSSFSGSLYEAESGDICSLLREGIALYGANIINAMKSLIADINVRRSMHLVESRKNAKWVDSILNTYCQSGFILTPYCKPD